MVDNAVITNVESNFISSIKNESNDVLSETTIADENNIQSTRSSVSNSLHNYPIVDQNVDGTQRGLCWAATVASMCKYEKPSTYGTLTAKEIADYMNVGYDEGGTDTDAKYALKDYLGSPYVPTITGVLSDDAIKTVIDNNDPAYMANQRKTGYWPWNTAGHAVALIGYSFTSTGDTIVIMDPAYEKIKAATRVRGVWSFSFGDTSFSWKSTVKLSYN